MSGSNANCHVSTKWEDTSGEDNAECNTNILIGSSDTNGDSLQELIDKELALRSTTVTNGVDRPKSLLICDMNDNNHKAISTPKKVNAFDIFDNVTPINCCKRSSSFKLTRGVAVTEVDDFDVLYNEVSSDELVSNGHVTLTGLLSPEVELSNVTSVGDGGSERTGDINNGMLLRDLKVHCRDNEKSRTVLVEDEFNDDRLKNNVETGNSLDCVCVTRNFNKSVDVINNSCFKKLASNTTNNDFVPVSEVDIVVDVQEDDMLSNSSIVDDYSTVSMNSMIDVQKVVEDMEDSRHVVDDSDLITNPEKSVNQIPNNDNDAIVDEATTNDGNDINNDREGHYEKNVSDGCSVEDINCSELKVGPEKQYDVTSVEGNTHFNGDIRDGEHLNLNVSDVERWNTVASNVTVVKTCENSITARCNKLIEECSYDLTMSTDASELNTEEKKNVKKKKSTSEESVTTTKTKKTKKTKKCEKKENISVNVVSQQNVVDDFNFHQIVDDSDELSNVCVRALQAGFGKFDQLTKKAGMHVHSSDAAKTQQQFSQNDASQDSGNLCKACNKNVFAMEQIKAERHVWHKNCFRCKTCNKQLTVDGYSSHEGELYCKPHFRDLFKPKMVIEEEQPTKLKKPELIIRENEPMELPPDVIRASDKPDLGLEELSSLNVKSRFQVFEKPQVEATADKFPISVKRSPSILSKLAKFQAKGMDVGVSSDIFNGIDYEESSSSEEEPAPNDNITRSTVVKEKPIAFNKMNDVKKNWENGQASNKEERLEQRREELQNIRSRIFMGKQNKMKEAYENAVAESERGNVKKDVEISSEKARSIKEKFEKGEVLPSDESDTEQEKKSHAKQEDIDVFEAGISKQSRSIFQQMDAAMKTQSTNNVGSSSPSIIQNGHRSQKESESPERDIEKKSDVIRCDEQIHDENEVLKKSNTTSKMLSLFRQLEEAQDVVPDGPKPMKKFTPPPQSHRNSESESEDESEQSETSNPVDDIVRASDKTEDKYLQMAQKAVKAKALKEKFEKWEPEKQLSSNANNLLNTEQTNQDTAKSLRARFESMKAEQSTEKPRPKVNRFVEKSLPGFCDRCFKTVYPLEKVEAGDKVFHKNCFKCSRCHGILRMETFTMNNGHLYCVAHFKQLFISKGNYDEGFGNHQHKYKWPVHTGLPVANGIH